MTDREYQDQRARNSMSWCMTKAEHCRGRADELSIEFPEMAKRYREAAHHLETAAACLEGSRTFATEAELAETRAKYGAGEGVDRA